MSKYQHTPTPWTYGGYHVTGGNGYRVASQVSRNADGELIVRAVNSHAAMLAALRLASEQMSAHLDYEQDAEMDAALLAVDEAIAKAVS